jgi:hypothetical protein
VKRKTLNGEDLLFALNSLGFKNYAKALKTYLQKYREVKAIAEIFQAWDVAGSAGSASGQPPPLPSAKVIPVSKIGREEARATCSWHR